MKYGILTVFTALFCCAAFGQKNIKNEHQNWLRYTASLDFPSRSSLLLEAESRRFFTEKGYAAVFFRSQWQKPLKKKDFVFEMAAASFRFYPQNFSEAERELRPQYWDIRIHQGLSWRHALEKMTLSTRLRFEERFIQQNRAKGSNDFKLLPRLRMALLLNLPLGKRLELRGSNDFVMNLFQKDNPNLLDRNLLAIGALCHLTRNFSAELGYTNQFIQRAMLGEYTSRHIIRLFFLHNFSLGK